MIENIQLRKTELIKPTEIIPNDYDKMVKFGNDNRFPQFLLSLYDNDGLLHSIVSVMTSYIYGDGFDGEDKIVNKRGERLANIINKCVVDYVVFGSFAFQVIRNVYGDVNELYHIKVENVRTNEDNSKVFYRKSWEKKATEYVFEANNNSVNSSIFYFKSGSSRGVYGMPFWSAVVDDVQTDIEISHYNLNTVSNAFTPSAIVTLIGETPTDDEKRKIKNELEDRFCGSDNNSGLLISFAEDAEHTPKIETFNGDNNTDRYLQLRDTTRENIITGMRMQPILLGAFESSSGFNSIEFSSAFKLYQRTVIAPIQKEIERAFGSITNKNGETPFNITIKEFNIKFDEQEVEDGK